MKIGRRYPRMALYAAVGIVLYLAFLVVTIPATWLAWGIARGTEGRVVMSQPEGGLWRGSADVAIQGSPTGALQVGRVQWWVQPLWLLLGRLELHLTGKGPDLSGSGVIRLSGDGIVLKDLSAAAPTRYAGLVYAPINFFAPTGRLALTANELAIDGSGLHGDAALVWEQAGGRFTVLPQLGDYRLDLAGSGAQAKLRLSTLRGALQLTGEGDWQVGGNGQIRFVGHAVPRERHADLEPLLSTLGRDQGNGRRELRFNARAPLVQAMGFRP